MRFADGALWALDQTQLPWREEELALHSAADVVEALRRLSIRGAPLIGVAAAYGVALELARDPEALETACATLVAARPTAVNLAHAVRRVRAAAEPVPAGPARAAAALRSSSSTSRQGSWV